MDPLPLDRFLGIVEGTLLSGAAEDVVVQHVSTHSGRLRVGAAFFALAGKRSDGHDFVPDADRNGAVAAIVERGRVHPHHGLTIPIVEVDDTLRALQRLAGWCRTRLRGDVVAVAGSNGKTITKDALAHLASVDRIVYASPGSYNSQLGVALALLECPRNCELAVIEVAVSEPGEMAYLERIVRPDAAVITNVGHRWRENFASAEDHVDEMLAIASNVSGEGWVVLGDDDPAVAAVAERSLRCPVHVVNRSDAGPSFSPAEFGPDGLTVDVGFAGRRSGTVSVRTPSEEILGDVELALTAACLLGVDSNALITGAQDYRPTATRLEIWQSPGGVTLIRDVATPDPLVVGSAIRTANRFVDADHKVVVVLAETSVPWPEGSAVNLANVLITEKVAEVFGLKTPDHYRIVDEIKAGGRGTRARLFDEPEELRRHLLEELHRGDVALVQSAPDRPIGDLSTALIESMAPTRLYLDLSAVHENVTTFRRLVGPSVRLVGMVKALAYGTDAVSVSMGLQEAGVDFLGVSNADEGAALRRAGINLPILVMLGTGAEVDKMVRNRLTPVLYSPEMVDAVLALPDLNEPLSVHLEVDTGMHRTGFEPGDAIGVLNKLVSSEDIVVEGIMTHLASADDPTEDDFTREQLVRFDLVNRAAEGLGLRVLRHAAATAATIRLPEAHFDMVRIGLGLYGLHPSEFTRQVELVPAAALVSRINQEIFVPEGERVGYGGTYASPVGGGWVGVVPAGYHDCIPRAFSNFGYVVVAGKRCPIIGRVSMDSMTIDLSGCPTAHVGADVLIYGRYGEWVVPLEEVSAAIDTIPYEVMARVGPRVQRIITRH